MKKQTRTLSEELDKGAIAAHVEVALHALAALEAQLSHVVQAVVAEQELSTWLEILDQVSNGGVNSA